MFQYLNELTKRLNNVTAEFTRQKNETENNGKRLADLERLVAENDEKLSESEKAIKELENTVKHQAIEKRELKLEVEKISKLIAGKCEESGESSSKSFRNTRKRQQLTVREVSTTPWSLRSSKCKFEANLSVEENENTKKVKK